MTSDDPVTPHPDGAAIAFRVVVRAPRTAVAGRHGAAYRVRLAAPPVEGAANAELLRHLASVLGVRVADLRLVMGERSRDKVVVVTGLDAVTVRARLDT